MKKKKSANVPAKVARTNGGDLYISQVSEILGVSSTMVRQWEKHGFITPTRTDSGFRVYTSSDIQQLQKVRDLVQAGVNPAGIELALERGVDAGFTPHPITQPTAMGSRLQWLRQKKNLTLRQLARQTELSPSHISAIERSLTHPSVAVLQKMVAALGTNMIGLIGGDPTTDHLVVRPHERRPLDINLRGVEIQQLYRIDTVLESLLFLVEPGADSETYHHDGEEFLYVLSGTFNLILDKTEEFVLNPGDAMSFQSHRPHRFSNTGTVTAVVLWVNTPPTF
jgi:DNA-binding transcriptional MerR regulator/quercetin dioxygenase-like cupin family protein